VHAGRNDQNNQEMFVLGRDGQVYHSYSTPGHGSGWSAWGALGGVGSAQGDVAVWRTRSNNQQLSMVGADNAIWSNTATPGIGSGWDGWKRIGGPAGVTLQHFIGLDDAKIVGQMRVWVIDSTSHYWTIEQTTFGPWVAWSASAN